MISLVVDASVIVKWVLPDRTDESDTGAALELLGGIRLGRIRVFQPPHWLAEVAGVLIRLTPSSAKEDIATLHDLSLPEVNAPEIYATACDLSHRLQHHLFDTLYHAVALERSAATLVTADEGYFRKAKAVGRITRLRDVAPRIAHTQG